MELRWYQTAAVQAVYAYLEERDDNPCVVMPTGSGKSPTIAQIARDVTIRWHSRCLVVAHRKELLEQNARSLLEFEPNLDIGIYSAGLKRRDAVHSVVFGGIQSIFARASELGSFALILVDEAHLIPLEGEGMYRKLLADMREINPGVRVIGFTATPYRMKAGQICSKDGILNEICYEVHPAALITQGFLTRLISYGGEKKGRIDTTGVPVRGGEFVPSALEARALSNGRVAAAVKNIIEKTDDRKKVLIFTTGVKHCETVALELSLQSSASIAVVIGTTPQKERDEIVQGFREGKIKYLVNVEVFTEGLDVPDIDCIVLLRPTKSPGLYVQMVGRGFRVAPDKRDCLILDYGDNVLRHGPVDRVVGEVQRIKGGSPAPIKECPECLLLISAGYATCPGCAHIFPVHEAQHDTDASALPIMSKLAPEWIKIDRVRYNVHTKYDAPDGAPRTIRVDYHSGLFHTVSEWICVEHEGYARVKAMKWWRTRQKLGKRIPCPDIAEDAVMILQGGAMLEPAKILVKQGYGRKDFDRILDYEFPLLDGSLASDLKKGAEEDSNDEVPF